MPLRLNLFHEAHQARSARQRDPLKISLYILGGIVAGFAALYAIELGRYASASNELTRKQAEFAKLEPEAAAAKKREESFEETQKINTKLVKGIEDRFYWAPVLQQVATLVPREVQINKLAGDVQGTGVRKCQLTVDGLSAGADPRKVAEELRQSIAESFAKNFRAVDAKFRALEDGTELVMLDGKQWPTASFAISINFESGEEPPAAPVPGARRKARGAAAEPDASK
jgi:Tfp pilus assembly protein PilN